MKIFWCNGSGSVLRSFGYGYNDAGMITNVARETVAESVAYGYDSLDFQGTDPETPGTPYKRLNKGRPLR